MNITIQFYIINQPIQPFYTKQEKKGRQKVTLSNASKRMNQTTGFAIDQN